MMTTGRNTTLMIVLIALLVVFVFVSGFLFALQMDDGQRNVEKNLPENKTEDIYEVNITETNETEEFAILEIPPGLDGLEKELSSEVITAIDDVIGQDPYEKAGSILDTFNVKYVIFYNKSYKNIFSPYLFNESKIDQNVDIAQVDMDKSREDASVSFLTLGEGWFEKEYTEDGIFRWSSNQSIVHYYKKDGGIEVLGVNLTSRFDKSSLEIYVNGELLDVVNIANEKNRFYLILDTEEGVNNITFLSPTGCIISDIGRCLSFSVMNIELMDLEEIESTVRYQRVYEGTEEKWIGKSGNINIFVPQESRVLFNLQMSSYAVPRDISIVLNGENIGNEHVMTTGTSFTKSLILERGENEIDVLVDGCSIPAEIEGSEDQRCLGIQLEDVSFTALG